jgi:osmoprotectant transport system substrate-binding protein
LRPILDSLGPLLDNETITQLNARVDLGADGERNSGDEEAVAQVAYDFARKNRLLKLPTINVANGADTQQQILGQIIVQILEQTGYGVVNKTGAIQAASLRQALESGEIDIYPEGMSYSLINHIGLPLSALPSGAERTYALLQALDERNDIIWLKPGNFNDAFALLTGANLAEVDLTTISDLASYINTTDSALTFCAEAEFTDGETAMLSSLETAYGFGFDRNNITVMAIDNIYEALRNGTCDVGQGYYTGAQVSAWELKTLTDDLEICPINLIAPNVRKAVLQENLDLGEIFVLAFEVLDNATMSQLNAQVEFGADGELNSGDEQNPAEVARGFLTALGLIE